MGLGQGGATKTIIANREINQDLQIRVGTGLNAESPEVRRERRENSLNSRPYEMRQSRSISMPLHDGQRLKRTTYNYLEDLRPNVTVWLSAKGFRVEDRLASRRSCRFRCPRKECGFGRELHPDWLRLVRRTLKTHSSRYKPAPSDALTAASKI